MNSKVLLLSTFLLLICSCNNLQESDMLSSIEDNKLENADKIAAPTVSSESIVRDADIDNVVEAVATSDRMGKSRQEAKKYARSTYVGKDGTPSVYVINYPDEKGFILLSATKNYAPVLAFSPKGNFDAFDKSVNGLDVWKAETLEALSIAKRSSDKEADQYRRMWKSYESKAIEPRKANRKSMTDFDVSLAWHQQLQAWQSAGYTVYGIDSNITGDPAIDAQFRYAAQQGIYPLYEDDWEQYSAVVEHEVRYNDLSVNNFIQSTWYQEDGYRDSCFTSTGLEALVGCGPIAIGQVMRYFQYPASFNWSNMPYNSPTPTTAQFLHTIGVVANVNYQIFGTGITKEGITDALEYYNYTYSSGIHNSANVSSSISSHFPVIMLGYLNNSSSSAGHAWVASGQVQYSANTRYEVYTFTNRKTIGVVDTYDTNHTSISNFFYMNWGWRNSSLNGYYYDSSVSIANKFNSISNRYDFYNIHPNQ